MRVAVTGTNGIGKSTFINDFLQAWPGFKTPENTFRDVLTDRYSEEISEERQDVVLDHMIKTMQAHGKNDNIIYDRCPVDNIVYSLWANNYGLVSSDYIKKAAARVKSSLRMLDLIFFIPVTKSDKISLSQTLSGNDHIDESYATEIDNIFKAMYREWDKTQSIFVDVEDKPHVIEVFGTREERTQIAKLYVTEDGDAFGESSIVSPDELAELEKLNRLVTTKSKKKAHKNLDRYSI